MNREKCTLVPTDKLKEMQAEINEQARIIGMSGEREASLLARVERLERENEALRKDAERYRWLRDDKNQLSEDDICVSDSSFTAYFKDDLDAAIDAAIEGQ
jgi:septal ring factor EnvC (AmiA/AmiB activator)